MIELNAFYYLSGPTGAYGERVSSIFDSYRVSVDKIYEEDANGRTKLDYMKSLADKHGVQIAKATQVAEPILDFRSINEQNVKAKQNAVLKKLSREEITALFGPDHPDQHEIDESVLDFEGADVTNVAYRVIDGDVSTGHETVKYKATSRHGLKNRICYKDRVFYVYPKRYEKYEGKTSWDLLKETADEKPYRQVVRTGFIQEEADYDRLLANKGQALRERALSKLSESEKALIGVS
jgi:hypothetical protein